MNIAKAPWTVENEECGDIISDDLVILSASPEFRMVATISRCYQGDRIPAMEAEHARLIAAAPDLLKQLADLLAMCERQEDFNDDRDGGMFERSHAAIAKATGSAL